MASDSTVSPVEFQNLFVKTIGMYCGKSFKWRLEADESKPSLNVFVEFSVIVIKSVFRLGTRSDFVVHSSDKHIISVVFDGLVA